MALWNYVNCLQFIYYYLCFLTQVWTIIIAMENNVRIQMKSKFYYFTLCIIYILMKCSRNSIEKYNNLNLNNSESTFNNKKKTKTNNLMLQSLLWSFCYFLSVSWRCIYSKFLTRIKCQTIFILYRIFR